MVPTVEKHTNSDGEKFPDQCVSMIFKKINRTLPGRKQEVQWPYFGKKYEHDHQDNIYTML